MEIQTAAATILGFQLAGLAWRVSREIAMNKEGEPTWFPLADWQLLLSLCVIGVFVFVIPLGIPSATTFPANVARVAFGAGMLLLILYPVTLAAHYCLIQKSKPTPRPYAPCFERALFGISVSLAVLYAVLSALFLILT